ncbi:MAG: 16S rRNA (guanine(966)-N(2))-methyltransferase RsmD [Planctomycetota bacterium]
MRITGGELKGRLLESVKGDFVRPASDRVRQALFQILGHGIEGDILDLFAGMGSVGIEALSRGADRAVFVEKDRRCLGAIRANLAGLDLAARADVVPGDVYACLDSLAARRAGRTPFSHVFCDPPYAQSMAVSPGTPLFDLIEGLAGRNLLAPDGVLVFERRRKGVWACEWPSYAIMDHRSYGETILTFMRRKSP